MGGAVTSKQAWAIGERQLSQPDKARHKAVFFHYICFTFYLQVKFLLFGKNILSVTQSENILTKQFLFAKWMCHDPNQANQDTPGLDFILTLEVTVSREPSQGCTEPGKTIIYT